MRQPLREYARRGDLAGFETRCLELLENGELPLSDLPACFHDFVAAGMGEHLATLAQMILENIDFKENVQEALAVACAALYACPSSDELRRTAIELYRLVHGGRPDFEAILESSGLSTGGPARSALRVLDFCLALNVGDTLISRTDGRVVEVLEVDRHRGLFTLRRGDRSSTTIPAREVVSEYERIDPNDFRVIRQFRPEKLSELISVNPVALVIGLLHSHGGSMDSDQLKDELVPRYVSPSDWPKWWAGVRTQLKRHPHVLMEGRNPVIVRYSEQGVTLEAQTWHEVASFSHPARWLAILESYFREQRQQKLPPDPDLLQRCYDRISEYVSRARQRRPAEALAGALVLARLQAVGETGSAVGESIAAEILREADDPSSLVAALDSEELWTLALDQLPLARPADWADVVVKLVPSAPASQLDRLLELARSAGRIDGFQRHIDDALTDVLDYPELVYWLWKGPADPSGLNVADDGELFSRILETLVALDTTLNPPRDGAKHFRSRMKAAFELRGYGKVSELLRNCDAASAVTLRRQIERLRGLGENAREHMLKVLRQRHPGLWARRAEPVAPWEDPDVIWTTAAGIERKVAERDELVNVKMRENAIRIGEAGRLGDLSENSEFRFALEERDLLRARLAQLNRELSIARALSPQDVPTDHVGLGTRVRLRRVADGSERQMTFLGPFDADTDRGIYSYRAPVAQKLMGRRVGDSVLLAVDGKEDEFEIVAIENGLAVEAAPAAGSAPV